MNLLPGRDVPMMSGGLLGISRQWWWETGGLDDQMVAWGGHALLKTWGSNGVQKTAKTAEKRENRLFHKNRFFDNFKLYLGGLGVSGGMAWTMRTDSLEVWRDLVLHVHMGIVTPKSWGF